MSSHYAVILDEADRFPQFSIGALSSVIHEPVVWKGAVYPRISGANFGRVVGRSGLLVRRGLRLYLRGNDTDGKASDVLIDGVKFDTVCRYNEYYVEWDLVSIVRGQEKKVFSAPKLLPELGRQEASEENLVAAHWSKIFVQAHR